MSGEQLALMETDGGAAAETRGPGRPLGSKNRRQKDIAEAWLAANRDPLWRIADVLSMSAAHALAWAEHGDGVTPEQVQAMAKRLNGIRGNQKRLALLDSVLRLKLKAATDILPYLHSRMPTETEEEVAKLIEVRRQQVEGQSATVIEGEFQTAWGHDIGLPERTKRPQDVDAGGGETGGGDAEDA